MEKDIICACEVKEDIDDLIALDFYTVLED